MKKSIILIYVFATSSLFSSEAVAQIPVMGSYVENKTMTPFHGTWLWTDGTDSITFILETRKLFFNVLANGGFDEDVLAGWHIYRKKGIIIENTIQYMSKNEVNIYAAFMGSNVNFYPQFTADGSLNDISKKKTGDLQLDLDTTISPHRLIWKLENSEGIRIRRPGEPPFDVNFTLPLNMVFIKQ